MYYEELVLYWLFSMSLCVVNALCFISLTYFHKCEYNYIHIDYLTLDSVQVSPVFHSWVDLVSIDTVTMQTIMFEGLGYTNDIRDNFESLF